MTTRHHEKMAQKRIQGLDNLAKTAHPDHPIVPPKPPSESERLSQIIESNLRSRNTT